MKKLALLLCAIVLTLGGAAGDGLAAAKTKKVAKPTGSAKGTWVSCRNHASKLKRGPLLMRKGPDGWYECWLPK